MSAEELKKQILDSAEDFVDQVVLGPTRRHVSDDQVKYVADALSEKFGAPVGVEHIYIVGSAKIGFALFEKRQKNGTTLPAFRPFRGDSDIDVAVVCPDVFDLIWDELSGFVNRQSFLPWDSQKLGDYLVYGWIRPDHFPKNVRLRRCDDWWDVFRTLSADPILGRRAIRGGLYRTHEQLRRYHLRGISQCKSLLEASI